MGKAMSDTASQITRRQALAGLAAGAAAMISPTRAQSAEPAAFECVDAHVHIWDLDRFRMPWLDHSRTLKRSFSIADYREAAKGIGITSAVYIEVNVEPSQRHAEADAAIDLCRGADALFRAAVIAGDPREAGFAAYLDRYKNERSIAGVRCLYPKGASEDAAFIKGMQALAERDMTFDLQLGPDFLADAAKTAQRSPRTRFVLDHCGGITPAPFRKDSQNDRESRRLRETWLKGISKLAACPNVVCKISGIADAALPGEATAEDVAPAVNHCLDEFGPDRVLFGGNWPVCLKGVMLANWVNALRQIVSGKSEADHRKLLRENAIRAYSWRRQ